MLKRVIFIVCLVAATQLEKDLQLWPMLMAALSQNETSTDKQTAPQPEIEKTENPESHSHRKAYGKKVAVSKVRKLEDETLDLDDLESRLQADKPKNKISEEFTLNHYGAIQTGQNVIKSIYINDDEFNDYLEAFINDEMDEAHWESIQKKYSLSPEQRRLLASYLTRTPSSR